MRLSVKFGLRAMMGAVVLAAVGMACVRFREDRHGTSLSTFGYVVATWDRRPIHDGGGWQLIVWQPHKHPMPSEADLPASLRSWCPAAISVVRAGPEFDPCMSPNNLRNCSDPVWSLPRP